MSSSCRFRRLHEAWHLHGNACRRSGRLTLPGRSRLSPPTFYSCRAQSGSSRRYDVVIAGGGIMGCSSAYHLAKRMTEPSSICIVERDVKYKQASTVLSVSSIRQQFSVKGNVQMSLFSYDFMKNIDKHLSIEGDDPVDVQLFDSSYLFLASDKGVETLRENYETQKSVGAQVELLKPDELKRKFPWINTDGVALGSNGLKNEGWFDPWLLLNAFKKKAISQGVHYLDGEITGMAVEDDQVKSVQVNLQSGDTQTLHCNHLVNSAGPWAADIARMAGIGDPAHPNLVMQVPLPVKPRRRFVFVVKCPSAPAIRPMIIDTTGFFCRKESASDVYICGCSPPSEKDEDGGPLEVDYSMFDDVIWPALAHRVPAFEALKLHSAWAGYYDYNTLDQNALIGAHPVISNLVFVNGFSGHGIQQSPAAGRAVSEIILDGRTSSIDLSEFSFERVVENKPLREKNIV